MNEITSSTGIAAVFYRGFMECYYSGHEKLYDCQAAGKEAVEEAGDTISDGYISKLSRNLVDARVVGRKKIGRHYINRDDEYTEDFKKFLADYDEWGLLTQGTMKDLQDKSAALDEFDRQGAIRGGSGGRIPRSAFKVLMEQSKAGKLDILFVQAGLPVAVKYHDKTRRIECFEDE